MSWERYGGLRVALAQLAAQIMYGEGVKQYLIAKRLAARRLLGRIEGKAARYRTKDLPSNGEIKQALLELVSEIEGDGRVQRLFAMRIVALEAMECLAPFTPRLMGSVATGHVRSGSDIDIHVFAWHSADVESHVGALGWVHDVNRVSILKHGRIMNFAHILVPDVFPIEMTVYPPNELRNRPRSSTDGKPILRLGDGALRKICEAEHPELWRRYLADGSTPTLDDILVAEGADEAVVAPLTEPPEPVDEDEPEAPEEQDEREPRIRRPRDTTKRSLRRLERG